MNKLVEIVEFYPDQRKTCKKYIGTLHVYVVINGLEMDLRGLRCYKVKTNIYIFIPDFKTHDDGELVRYPMFNLTNHDLHKELMAEIIAKGREFIAKKLKELPSGINRKPHHARPYNKRSDYGSIREGARSKPRANYASYVHPRDFSIPKQNDGKGA